MIYYPQVPMSNGMMYEKRIKQTKMLVSCGLCTTWVIAINSWRPQFCKDMKRKCHVCDLVTPKPLAHRFYDYPRARLT